MYYDRNDDDEVKWLETWAENKSDDLHPVYWEIPSTSETKMVHSDGVAVVHNERGCAAREDAVDVVVVVVRALWVWP